MKQDVFFKTIYDLDVFIIFSAFLFNAKSAARDKAIFCVAYIKIILSLCFT